MITSINEFRKYNESLISKDEVRVKIQPLRDYYTKVATLVLNYFKPNEITMAGLTVPKLIDELTTHEHPETKEYVLRYDQLTKGIDEYFEEGISAEEAAKQLYTEFKPLVSGQLSAM